MAAGGEGARRRPAARMRLSEGKRARFLEVLGQSGNRRLAAEAIGGGAAVDGSAAAFDPLLDREWKAAVEQAERRLAAASGPLDCIGGTQPMVIRRGPGGWLRIVKAGPRRWSRKVEDRFFAALRESGNIPASARAVGFSASCIAQRRRQWSGFAQRIEEALGDAELALEFRLAIESGGMKEGIVEPRGDANSDSVPERPEEPAKFDPDLAMRFLEWRAEKKRGGGERRRAGKRPLERSFQGPSTA